MSENINSSYIKNKGLTWMAIRVSTLVATILSCFPALIIIALLRNYQVYGFFIASFIVGGTFFIAEYFRGGRYEYQRYENFISKFNIVFPKKDLNKETIARSAIKNEEWYLPSGDQLIGFELLDNTEILFESFVTCLLPILPTHASVKFIKPQIPDKNPNVSKFLKTKNISKAEYYIFVRLPNKIGDAIGKSEIKEKILGLKNSKVRLLNYSEMSAISEQIFFPFQEPTNKNIPFFRSPIKVFKGRASGLWPEQSLASFSLVQLPESYVNADFQFIYNSINNLTGCICVTLEVTSRSIIKNSYRMSFNKKHNNLDDTKEKNQSISDNITVKMQVGILIHAKPSEVSDTIFALDIACNSLGNEYKPIFSQDLAFLDKALSQYLPDTRPELNFRTNTVTSLKEILCYLPRPDYSFFKKDFDLMFRTVNNKLFSFEQNQEYPNLFIGDMGAGKSTLLFLNIKAHIEKKNIQNVAGCYVEIGGSFRYLAYRGLADVNFIMRNLDNGNTSPFADHPLRVFKYFGTSGQESALKFITCLCKISDLDKELQFKIENLIADTLAEFYAVANSNYDLAEFFLMFERKAKTEYPKIIEDKDNSLWIVIKNLARFVDPKHWGNIFCPDKPMNYDYEKARFFYFTTFESSLNPDGIYKPFFTFAVLVSELVAEKYSSNRANPCKIQFLIDEVARLKNFIPEDLYLNLNSQARKEGKIPFLATQQAEDLALDERKWGSEKYKLVKSAKRMFFYQFPGPEILLAQFLEVPTDDPKIKKIRSVSKSNFILKERGIYAWGYIDENKNVHQLIVDIDKETLWGCTTHAGGIAIREACMRENIYSYKEICELLAERGPWPIPKVAGISEQQINKYVNDVIFRGKKND
ncbi:MAG: hypothetical protein K2X69_01755 [Silvanigrellaceae bacterium]|nr:hypothetical protein [Silvanigrellaceae bacterium]